MLRLDQIGKKWKAVSSVGAVVIATTTAFFRPPPVGESGGLIAIGGFLATVCSGLIYVGMVRWAKPSDLSRWVAAAAIGTAAAVASFYLYEAQWDSRVATYQGHPQVIGDVFTTEGAEWVRRSGHTEPSALLFDAAGQAEQIWTIESIQNVRSRMRLAYLAGFPLVAVGILATIQAVHCVLRKPDPKKRGRNDEQRAESSGRPARV
jgi:hypothetical protein